MVTARILQPDLLGLNHEYKVGQIAQPLRASLSSFVKWVRFHHLPHSTLNMTDTQEVLKEGQRCYWLKKKNVTSTARHDILVPRVFCFLFFFPTNHMINVSSDFAQLPLEVKNVLLEGLIHFVSHIRFGHIYMLNGKMKAKEQNFPNQIR